MSSGDYNPLDWCLIIIIGASILFGFRAGLVRVVIGFAAGVLGILLGFWFYQTPAAWFSGYFESATASSALGFLVVFVGTVVAGGIFARLLGAIFKWAGVGWLDRLLGAGVGFLRGMAVAVGIVTPLLAFSIGPMPKLLEESQLAPYTVAFGKVLITMAPAPIREQFESKANVLKSIWKDELKKALPGFGKPDTPSKQGSPKPLKKESY